MPPIYASGGYGGSYAPPRLGFNAGNYFGGGLMGDLTQSYTDAYNQANQANNQRYEDILGGYRQRYSDAMGQLQGWGDQQRADLATRWKGAENRGMMDLAARGLGGTTIAPSIRSGFARQYSADQARLDEQLKREQLGYQNQLSGDTLAFMERRNDVGPDLGQLAALASQVGQQQGYGQRPYGFTQTATVNRGPSNTMFGNSLRALRAQPFGGRSFIG